MDGFSNIWINKQKSIKGWVNGELIDKWINNSINQQRNGLIDE